jgi:hypothetical protein
VVRVAVGSYQLTIAFQEVALGFDPYTGRSLSSDERGDIVGAIAGGVVGGGVIAGGYAAIASRTTTGVACSETAQNVMNGARRRQQLALESANSAFTADGTLSQGAIDGSNMIIRSDKLINTAAIPDGFAKYSTETFQSPAGDFQVHFYQNPATGEIFYGLDYKAVFNVSPGKR